MFEETTTKDVHELDDMAREDEGYTCINCDRDIDPNKGSMYCSDKCEVQYNEDLKAELKELRAILGGPDE